MNTIQPEITTALRALTVAIARIESAFIGLDKDPDAEIADIILREAGAAAVHVALNAIETLGDFGIDFSLKPEEPRGVFAEAFKKLQAGPLSVTPKA